MRFVAKDLEKTAEISRGAERWRISWRRVLCGGLVLLAFYFAIGLLADFAADSISDEWEARTFQLQFGDEPENDPDFKRTRDLFETLTREPGLRALPYRLSLLDEKNPNAFALPGGAVGVTRGLLDLVKSEEGMALVLAHELGHHQGRDALRSMGRTILLRLATSLALGDSEPMGLDLALTLAEAGHSRSQERRADEFGLRLVHRVLGRLGSALEFFEAIEREEGGKESRWAAFFRSHPLTRERIEHLRELSQGLKAERR